MSTLGNHYANARKHREAKASMRAAMLEAMVYCDMQDKSIEYTIQYMQDYSGCTFDEAIEFLEAES